MTGVLKYETRVVYFKAVFVPAVGAAVAVARPLVATARSLAPGVGSTGGMGVNSSIDRLCV